MSRKKAVARSQGLHPHRRYEDISLAKNSGHTASRPDHAIDVIRVRGAMTLDPCLSECIRMVVPGTLTTPDAS
jgi:hypothetical protein